MKKIGLIVKLANPDAVRRASEMTTWLSGKGITVYGDGELSRQVSSMKKASREELAEIADALVVLGGDGTMLYAARLLGGKKIPILGVNMGGLGFLTSAGLDDVHGCLEGLLEGRYETEERMMLSVRILSGEREIAQYRVLNDAVIRSTIARLLKLELRINNEYVTTYRSDGLIVATPTGSTAYSLSASGPILFPTIHSIIIVPVCPFNLTNRPMVIPDRMVVEVKVSSNHGHAELTLDGQVDMAVKAGDCVEVRRAKESVYLVKCAGKSYFGILRERLMWEPKQE
ncbi:MAG: NAD(+)/NADH kinase [Deltaproteobacteria bacterium]|nr:NAD(+)/NADH kinase [Deltaproteobacteria bacterium]